MLVAAGMMVASQHKETAMPRRPENAYDHYHAHVYFGADTLAQARALVTQAGDNLPVVVGRVHEKLVGPHPHWSCQLAFDRAGFYTVVPWLDANRGGLDILVHGLTGDHLADHTTHARWLGNEAVLDLRMFKAA